MNYSIIEHYAIDAYTRQKTETAYQTIIVPFWNDFTKAMRKEYSVVGDQIDWSTITGAMAPDVNSLSLSTNSGRSFSTGLKETYLMKPNPLDPEFELYISCEFKVEVYIGASSETSTNPRRIYQLIEFSVGRTMSELQRVDRKIRLNSPRSYNPESGVSNYRAEWILELDGGFIGILKKSTSGSGYYCGILISYLGDALLGTPSRDFICGLFSSGSINSYWYLSSPTGLRPKLLEPEEITGDPRIARIVLGETAYSVSSSYLFDPRTHSGQVTNSAGTEVLIPGPYISNGSKLWSGVFPGTPFICALTSQGGEGAEQIINGWKYRATALTVDFNNSNANYGYLRIWIRVGSEPVSSTP